MESKEKSKDGEQGTRPGQLRSPETFQFNFFGGAYHLHLRKRTLELDPELAEKIGVKTHLRIDVMNGAENWCTLSYFDANFPSLKEQYDPEKDFGLKMWSENEQIAIWLVQKGLVEIRFSGQVPNVR